MRAYDLSKSVDQAASVHERDMFRRASCDWYASLPEDVAYWTDGKTGKFKYVRLSHLLTGSWMTSRLDYAIRIESTLDTFTLVLEGDERLTLTSTKGVAA